MKDKKYAYSRARICKSPFSKGKTYEEALKMVKEKEKAYNSGKEIGFLILFFNKKKLGVKICHCIFAFFVSVNSTFN